jgi:hypothetical protein
MGTVTPVDGLGESDPSVCFTVGSAEGIPRVGSVGQVMEDALPFDVVVQPGPEPRPGAGQCFVCKLQDPVVTGHQPSCYQQIDQTSLRGITDHLPPGDPAGHRFTIHTRCHQPEQRVPQQVALIGCGTRVHLLRRLGHRTTDSAGRLISRHRQRATFATKPGFAQCVRQEWKCAGLALHLAYEEVYESRLYYEAGLAGRSLDRGAQIVVRHGSEQVEPALDEPGEFRMPGDVAQVVRSQ